MCSFIFLICPFVWGTDWLIFTKNSKSSVEYNRLERREEEGKKREGRKREGRRGEEKERDYVRYQNDTLIIKSIRYPIEIRILNFYSIIWKVEGK